MDFLLFRLKRPVILLKIDLFSRSESLVLSTETTCHFNRNHLSFQPRGQVVFMRLAVCYIFSLLSIEKQMNIFSFFCRKNCVNIPLINFFLFLFFYKFYPGDKLFHVSIKPKQSNLPELPGNVGGREPVY